MPKLLLVILFFFLNKQMLCLIFHYLKVEYAALFVNAAFEVGPSSPAQQARERERDTKSELRQRAVLAKH